MASFIRDGAPLGHAEIRDVLSRSYGLTTTELELLGGGLDAAAWTYRCSVRSRPDLVLRLKRGEPLPAAYLVPRHLRDAGAGAVVAPMLTSDQQLFVQLDGLTFSVYPFRAGDNEWTSGMTDRHWYDLGSAVRAVHDVAVDRWLTDLLPCDDPTVEKYGVLTEWDAAVQPSRGGGSAFSETWNRHRRQIHAMHQQMRQLVPSLRDQPRHDVVCHGDLHPGNVLIEDDRVHIIDWDDVLLAPRERDFIFAPHVATGDGTSLGSGGSPLPLAAAFFHGYDLLAADIDWVALTYYRCERVVQDVIALANQAVGTTASDAEEANRWLRYNFAPGGEAEAAGAAARHLSADLDVLGQG